MSSTPALPLCEYAFNGACKVQACSSVPSRTAGMQKHRGPVSSSKVLNIDRQRLAWMARRAQGRVAVNHACNFSVQQHGDQTSGRERGGRTRPTLAPPRQTPPKDRAKFSCHGNRGSKLEIKLLASKRDAHA